MTRFSKILGTAALALTFGTGSAMAQAPQPQTQLPQPQTQLPQTRAPGAAPTGQAATPKGTFKQKAPTTAAGKECSTQADAKGLHGAARKKFRATCKREMSAKAKG